MMRRAAGTLILLALPLMIACTAEPDAGTEGDTAAGTDTAQMDLGAEVDLAAEEQAIRERVAAWQEAANESAEAFASFYAPEGVLMAPNAPPAEGQEAIAQTMAPMLQVVENITFETLGIDIADSGDLAVERGRYTLSGTMPDGTSFDDQGSYVVAWEKVDGQWMVTHDIFNSDRPMQGAGEG